MTPPACVSCTAALLRRVFLLSVSLSAVSGCAMPLIRGQNPDPAELTLESVEDPATATRLVRDVVNASGLQAQKVESVALVTQLAGTGSDPPAGQQRQSLIDEIQTHDVRNPNELLTSPNHSLVLVRGYLPPGVQKGDRIDVEVRVPMRSETTSLRGGWLMQTRLRPMEQLGGQIRTGHIIALAEGAVLVDSAAHESEDKVLLTRGRVLGGGVAQTSRSLGLVIKKGSTSVATASLVGGAINARFYYFDGAKKKGVANPKSDVYIELALQPRYKTNVWRYVQVVKAVPLSEAPVDRLARLETLQLKLLEPTTASEAAIHLEAIGKEAIASLQKGLTSKDPEVRFHAATALVYLDEADAAPVLGEAAQHTPAFRWEAITALGTMDHINAYDALTNLLHASSAEARYGAFRALRARNSRDPLVRGEILGDGKVSYHVIPTTSEALLHFAKSQRPEIVLFGADVRLTPPTYLEAGKSRDILIKGVDDEHIKVVRFLPGHDDLVEICTPELTQIIPAILNVGGDYTDVMQLMQQAKKKGFLTARIAVDALPQAGRVYQRDDIEIDEPSSDEPLASDTSAGQPKALRNLDGWSKRGPKGPEADFNAEEKPHVKRSFFDRMSSWFWVE